MYADVEFAMRLFSSFKNYKQVSINPMRLNASCPICGDSQTDSFKARFWFYLYQDSYMVHCFNCDYSSGFSNFLKNQDEPMFREYLLEKRKEHLQYGGGLVTKHHEQDLSVFKSKMQFIEELTFCERLDKLPENHPIIKYVSNRKIPKHKWNRLYFTKNWQELVNKYKPDSFENPKPEPRLVIPIWNSDKKIESFQGRSLNPKSKVKYMTIKAHEDATKVYGTDTVDKSKDIWVFEGPIDSLFIDNAIAISGGLASLASFPFADKRVWVLDNEPRHPDVKSRYNKLIDDGERVVMWDKSPWKSKDVNDMIKDEGATPEQILHYLQNNIVSGLSAKLRSSYWFKV